MTMTTNSRLRLGSIAAAICAALAIAACGGSGSGSGASAATSPAAAGSANAAASAATAGVTRTAATGVAIGTHHGADGTYLVGAAGRALYLWVADSGGRSNCAGACMQVWPPLLLKGKAIAGRGVIAADLGAITRSGGGRQVTYKGHPLYYFAGDTRTGSTKGEGSDGFGAKWWLVSPSGAAITRGSAGVPAGSTGGSSGSSGGSSGSSGGGGSWG